MRRGAAWCAGRRDGCYDPGIDKSKQSARRGFRRLLTLSWHAFGFWALAFGAAACSGGGRRTVGVLGGFGAVWLLGLMWAVVKRRRTVLARVAGLVVVGLPVVGMSLAAPDVQWVRVGEAVRQRPELFARGMAIALAPLGVVAVLQVLFARAFRIQAERRGRDPARPRWHAFKFPLVLGAALWVLQCSSFLAMFGVLAGAIVWIFGLLDAFQRREPLKPHWVGLALAALLIGGWPPVSVDAFRTEIAVAVLRYEMGDTDRLCFVQIGGEDPPAEVLRGLADLPARIRPGSAAVFPDLREDESDVTDRDTGERGVVYSIGSIRRTLGNPMAVAVEGGTCGGVLAGAGGTYYVAWLFGYWVVVDYDMRWVS